MVYSIVVAKVYYSEEKGIYICVCVFLLICLAAVLLMVRNRIIAELEYSMHFTVVSVVRRGFSVALLE